MNITVFSLFKKKSMEFTCLAGSTVISSLKHHLTMQCEEKSHIKSKEERKSFFKYIKIEEIIYASAEKLSDLKKQFN